MNRSKDRRTEIRDVHRSLGHETRFVEVVQLAAQPPAHPCAASTASSERARQLYWQPGVSRQLCSSCWYPLRCADQSSELCEQLATQPTAQRAVQSAELIIFGVPGYGCSVSECVYESSFWTRCLFLGPAVRQICAQILQFCHP